MAKKIKPKVLTLVGGQHFSVLAEESLTTYPEIDVIVRGEGEETLSDIVNNFRIKKSFNSIRGISFREKDKIIHTPQRPLIDNLDNLPFPGYHYVKEVIHKYHFTMMAGSKTRYALIEGSRGCQHRCTFCTQWRHWNGRCRKKSVKRIVDEMEFCINNYGSKFLWLTDDNFGLDSHMENLCDEIIKRRFSDDVMWFFQARCDDVVKNEKIIPKLRKAGNRWILLGVESQSRSTLREFNKQIDPEDSKKAIKLLKENDIFSQATVIIGHRKDSSESLINLREAINDLDPDLAIFMILTPFPGTEVYEVAKLNGWIQDNNWANYDMVHAIMPTEYLTREEVQDELYECYRSFYGSFSRRIRGLFSKNKLKRKTYRYMASQALLSQLRGKN